MDKQQAIERYLRIINQKSVSETEDEAKFGAFLTEELNKIPYFDQHPENILLQPVSFAVASDTTYSLYWKRRNRH